MYNKTRCANMVLTIIYIILLSLVACSCGNNQGNQEEMKMEIDRISKENLFAKYGISKEIIKNLEIIPDAKTAEKVSLDILGSIYGIDNLKRTLPLKVEFDSEYNVWVVSGKLKPGMLGGVPTIIIQKKDGKILAVTHTK